MKRLAAVANEAFGTGIRDAHRGDSMTDSSRDRIEGKVDELSGRGKSAYGDLADDDQKRAEGESDQTKGKVKQGLADVKDKVDDAVKKVTGN